MIERNKDYLKEKILTGIKSLYTYDLTGSLLDISCHYFHECIYNDIKDVIVCGQYKINAENQNIIELFSKILTRDFYSFTWEYYFYMKNNHSNRHIDINIIQLQYEYLCFLLYLYELISDNKKLNLFSYNLSSGYSIGNTIAIIKTTLDNEIGNYKTRFYYCKYYLKYYLQHRKEIKE